MASWDPLSMAQDVIRCTLCEDVPAELNCNTCHVGLCDGCVSKHITSKKSKKHDIVPFIAKKSEIQLPECKTHPNIKCELHCRQCNFAICSRCVASGSHKSHDLTVILDSITSMREAIAQKTTELDTLIGEEYEKIKRETQTQISKIQNDYQSLKKTVHKTVKLWHKELDVVIAQIFKNIEKMEKEDLQILNKQLSEMEKILTDIRNTSRKNKEVLESNDFTQIANHISKNEDFLNVPVRVELSPPTFTALKIDIERLSKLFGTLTSSIKTELSEYNIKMKKSISSLTSVRQLLDVPTEVTTTDTGGMIYSMTAVNTDQMWISRFSGCIDRVNIHGTTLETINPLSGHISYGLTMTQEGHLIFTDWRDKTVNLVRRGKIETVIRTGDWDPTRVCSTSTGDLLVCLDKKRKNKVVRYSGYKVKQEIEQDDKKKPLFAEGGNYLFIAENRDQNICVSDLNARSVLVLNQMGKLQFRYDGNLASNKHKSFTLRGIATDSHFRYDGNLASNKHKSFTPRGIATDSQSQILIADCNNNCVHIINRDGKFLRYIDNCHLDKPEYLSVDSSDQLFVSYDVSLEKIIKYMK